MSSSRQSSRLLPLFCALSLSACAPTALTPGTQPSPTPTTTPSITPTPVPSVSAQPGESSEPTPAPSGTPAASVPPTPATTPAAPTGTATPAAPAPAAPLNLQVVEQSASSLTLQWEFPSDARSFKLYLDGAQVAAEHVTPNYYRFEGLRAATTYRLGVQSVNTGGSSEIVSITTATTSSGRSASGNFSSGGNGGGGSSTRREGFSREEPKAYLVDRVQPAGIIGIPDVVVTPDVDINASGASVVVWIRVRDERGMVMAQRFDADGKAVGDALEVGETGNTGASQPQVGLDDDGNFVVTYTGVEDGGDANEVYYRYFRASGRGRAAERVNLDMTGNQFASGVSMNPHTGDFAIAWNSDGQNVMLQRYDADGTPKEAALTVNSQEFGLDSSLPGFAVSLDQDESGNLAVVWSGLVSGGSDGDIWLRHVSADGSMPDPEFVVNATTEGDQEVPTVAMNDEGAMVVSWTSSQAEDSDDGVFARQFAADGEPGPEFLVNQETEGSQSTSFVGMRPNGSFAIAWVSTNSSSFPVDSLLREYSAAGVPDEIVKINDHAGVSVIPQLAVNARQLAVAWFLIDVNDDSSPDNPPVYSIYTRRF